MKVKAESSELPFCFAWFCLFLLLFFSLKENKRKFVVFGNNTNVPLPQISLSISAHSPSPLRIYSVIFPFFCFVFSNYNLLPSGI